MSSEPPARGKLARALPGGEGTDGAFLAPRAATAEPTLAAVCPVGACDGSGWIVSDDTAHPCECRARRIARARARGVSGVIPRRFEGVSFDRPPVSDMARTPGLAGSVAAVRDYCATIASRLDAGDGLWLMGDVGTGKTSLAMLVSKAALAADRTVAIYSLPRLLARIRRTYDVAIGEDSYSTLFEKLTSVDLLHIDDLGAEKRTEWVLEQLYAIVDRRYEEQRPIVVTTNLDVPDLEEQIGPRTVSRLVEICGNPLPLYGDDKRIKMDAVQPRAG